MLNDIVFEAYLNAFSSQSYWLFQSELIEVAKWKDLTIRLWQPGWGQDRSALSTLLNPGGGRRIVDIHYNYSHYSRAQFILGNG